MRQYNGGEKNWSRATWSKIDWTRTNLELAQLLNKKVATVKLARRRVKAPPAKNGRPYVPLTPEQIRTVTKRLKRLSAAPPTINAETGRPEYLLRISGTADQIRTTLRSIIRP